MKSIKIEKISLGLFLLFAFCFTALKVSAEAAEEQNWTRYQNSETNNGVTDRPGPTDAEHTIALWDVSMEAAATTPPLIVDNKIYTASGYYVYCFDKTTGEKLGQSDKLTGYVGHALHPMVYAEGKLFVMTSKGGTMIEALSLSDANNPKSIWASTPQQGTGYTPLTYHYNKTQNKGYLYTGTSNGDDKGVYFCVSADNGNVIWSMEDENGFYWDGAYATDNYVAFASENVIGGDSEAEGSVLYTVNPVTGKVIDKVTDLKGSIRNTVVFDNGYLYVGTVAGRLYRIKVNSNGELGQYSGTNDENFSYIDVDGRIKATMLIYNKRLYAGVEGKTEGTSCYKVIDCSKAFSEFSIADSVWVENEPKGAPILSTAEDDILYIYFTCNKTNGGIYYFTDNGQSLSESKCLFEPESSQKQQQCISSLALDTDGTIYYTNDSHYLMAVASKIIKDVEVASSGSTSGISWDDNRFEPGVKKYNLTVRDSVGNLQFDVKKLDVENADVSYQVIVDGQNQGDNNLVSLDKEETDVELQVTRKAITLSYYFHIYKVTSKNTSLSLLYYGESFYSGNNLLGEIEEGKTEYSVDLRKASVNNPYLWVLPLHTGASIDVYAVENVKKPGSSSELASGKILDPVYIEMNGENKFEVNPADNTKNTVIRVRITSSDGSTKKDYQVKFIRADEKQPVTPPPSTQAPKPAATTTAKKTTTASVKIAKPKKVTILKAKKKKNVVTLKWKKIKGVTGYQITVAKDKKFRKYKKNYYTRKASLTTKKIKLTKKIKYVRVRAYVKKKGKTVFGTYSKILKINK